MIEKYTSLLKREATVRRLTAIQFYTYFGAWLVNVAIYTLLIEIGASPIWIGLIASAHFIMGIFQAPFSGAIIDRVQPKRLMVTLISIEIVATVGILFVESIEHLPLLFLLVAVRMGAGSFYFTTEMSLLPKLLHSEDLKIANELHSVIWSFTYSVGIALGGLSVYLFSIKTSIYIDLTLFVVSLGLLLTVKLPEFQSRKSHFFASMRDGLGYIFFQNRKVLIYIILHSFIGLLALDSLVAIATDLFYIDEVAVPIAIGAINSIKALSLVIGTLILSRYINRDNLHLFTIFQGVSIIVWGVFIEDFTLSVIGAFIGGFTSSLLWSYTYTLVQEATDKEYYGRVIAYNDMLFLGVSSLTAYWTAGAIDLGFSHFTILSTIGIALIIVGLLYRKIEAL